MIAAEEWKIWKVQTGSNNKLIGARTFINGATGEPPIDDEGHRTHTSSTAAGASVANADVLGNAKGIASGVAPKAHLAVYKVCLSDQCQGHDILASDRRQSIECSSKGYFCELRSWKFRPQCSHTF